MEPPPFSAAHLKKIFQDAEKLKKLDIQIKTKANKTCKRILKSNRKETNSKLKVGATVSVKKKASKGVTPRNPKASKGGKSKLLKLKASKQVRKSINPTGCGPRTRSKAKVQKFWQKVFILQRVLNIYFHNAL